MALKQNILIAQGTILQHNEKIEELRMICAESTTKMSSVEGRM